MAKLTIGEMTIEGTSEELQEFLLRFGEDVKSADEDIPKTITHKGEEFTLVDRKAKLSDVVVILKGGESPFFEEGDAYEVSDGEGVMARAYGSDGDDHLLYNDALNRTEENVLVYEKATNAFDKFPEGAKVRLLSGGGEYPLRGTENGSVYTVRNNDYVHDGVRKINIGSAYALPEQLELVAEDAPKEITLEVGDKVEVIDGSKSRYDDLSSGTIGEITDIDEDCEQPIRVDTSDDYDRFPADALRKVEEVSKYPEVGDIVRVTRDRYCAGFKNGTIGEVIHADETFSPEIKVDGKQGYARVEIVARKKDRVDAA